MKRNLCAMTALLGCCMPVAAADVYKCKSVGGRLSYQARPCAQGQSQSTVTIHKAPPPPPASASAAPPARTPQEREAILQVIKGKAPSRSATATPTAPVAPPPPRPVMSYKCTTENGWVFYWHHACPRIILTGMAPFDEPFGFKRKQPFEARVEGVTVPRAEACAEIYKVTASSRDGYQLDQRPSTYDKNLGRDKCHGY